MSPRGWQDRFRDILDAIAEIQRFTRGMDYETFKEDDKSIAFQPAFLPPPREAYDGKAIEEQVVVH